jgi:hypothetical protein
VLLLNLGNNEKIHCIGMYKCIILETIGTSFSTKSIKISNVYRPRIAAECSITCNHDIREDDFTTVAIHTFNYSEIYLSSADATQHTCQVGCL